MKTSNGTSATCSVTVQNKVVEPESVTLDQTEVTIKAGKTVTLVATINPSYADDQTLTWSSSNAAIASVDENGVVTGVAEGKATITVKTVNGKEARCEVTVLPKGSSGEDLDDPVDVDPWK